ncbi:hypothetical protein [Pseudovibrio sp. Tun.PSC04-5.I4]|uniref:hypothetical protein n=1 Tax=Pseudovibrio sp. Tun.PSC04-5.I4 TaxID=1798213 RepID=UPI000AF61843|nr:hypothetical protein [Pseudovibrio sp. Tun.PSC04-5.I4]
MIKSRDYLSPDNFYITNPNLGNSVRKDWLTSKLREVMDGSEEDDQQTFLAKHLNVPIGMNHAQQFPTQCSEPKLRQYREAI